MYYPEFLTETNLYTNGGEYLIASTREDYIGYYWRTFDGKYFTNKNPQVSPYYSLIPVPVTQTQNNGDSFIQPTPNYPKNDLNQKVALNPIPYVAKPTTGDYSNGFFYRYFSKPINSDKYIEISSLSYYNLINKDANINFTLNEGIRIKWVLGGFTQEEVFKQNKLIVEYTEINSNFKYLGQFLTFNYSKFYQT
jgi:hypothetical protein